MARVQYKVVVRVLEDMDWPLDKLAWLYESFDEELPIEQPYASLLMLPDLVERLFGLRRQLPCSQSFETALTALYPPQVVIWASDPFGQSIPKDLAARSQPCSFHGLWLSPAHQIANEPADLDEGQCERLLPAWMVPLAENVVAREFARHGAFFDDEEDYCRAATRLVATLPDLSYCNYLVVRHHQDRAFIQEMGMSHCP